MPGSETQCWKCKKWYPEDESHKIEDSRGAYILICGECVPVEIEVIDED